MKKILPLFLLLPLAAFSQHVQSDQTDDFGNLRRIATSRVEFKGVAQSLSGNITIREKDTLFYMNLIFRAGKATRTDEHTTVFLQLENGEVLQKFNQDKEKELTATEPGFLVFSLDEKDKDKLTSFNVVGYTIKTANATVDVKLNEQQQKAFYRTIRLLESQAASVASID